MNEADTLSNDAGETLATEKNPSEVLATEQEATPEKGNKAPSEDDGEARDEDKADDDAGEDAGEKKRLSGSARKAQRIRELEAELAAVRRVQSAMTAEPAKAPPRFEDYSDYEAFETARLQYAVETALTAKQQGDVQSKIAATQDEWQRSVVEDHIRRQGEARKVFDDYDKTIAAATDPVAPHVGELVLTSEKSELLQYHLAKHPGTLRELNGLGPVEASRLLGRIEARLSYPTARTETKAPAPVGALKGGSSPQFNPASASFEEMKALFARK